MRIAVFGAGVIGSLYAGRLALAGYEVELAARGRRLEALRERGLVLVDEAVGGPGLRAPARIVESIDRAAAYDFVLVAVRREQLGEALPELAALRGARAIVTMVNFSDGGAAVASAVGSSARARSLAAVCAEAGFPSAVSADMASWQRTHLALVSPIANALYASGGDIRAYAGDAGLISFTVSAIREGFGVVQALGGRVEPPKLAALIALPRFILAPAIGAALASSWGESVIARHASKARAEMRELAAELVGLADEAGAEAPALRRLARYA